MKKTQLIQSLKNWIASQKGLRYPLSCLPLQRSEVKLVIDVGAFTGHYATLACDSYPNSVVIAFEPSSSSAALLRGNTVRNSHRINLFQLAISDFDGEAELEIMSSQAANSLASQAQEHAKQNLGVRPVSRETVSVKKLDTILAELKINSQLIDVLKIDVEGLEHKVLCGAREALSRTRFVVIEISMARDESHDDQAVYRIFSEMRNQSFSLYNIIDVYSFNLPGERLGMAQFDAIFINNKIS